MEWTTSFHKRLYNNLEEKVQRLTVLFSRFEGAEHRSRHQRSRWGKTIAYNYNIVCFCKNRRQSLYYKQLTLANSWTSAMRCCKANVPRLYLWTSDVSVFDSPLSAAVLAPCISTDLKPLFGIRSKRYSGEEIFWTQGVYSHQQAITILKLKKKAV